MTIVLFQNHFTLADSVNQGKI